MHIPHGPIWSIEELERAVTARFGVAQWREAHPSIRSARQVFKNRVARRHANAGMLGAILDAFNDLVQLGEVFDVQRHMVFVGDAGQLCAPKYVTVNSAPGSELPVAQKPEGPMSVFRRKPPPG